MNNIRLINQTVGDFVKNIHCDEIIGEVFESKISYKHHYITLKNDDYFIKCNSWNKTYDIHVGDIVKITGKLSFMSKSFSIYFNVINVESQEMRGVAISMYDRIKLKLIDEGYILNKKRQITFFPYKIGLITADNSSVIKDVMSVFNNDNFVGKLYLKNTIMQGQNCSGAVIKSIEYFNEQKNVDIIMIFRGGGSKEDLDAFNDYDMMKSIGNSKILIIAAVGHATDTTELINYVADISKETPSLAGKYITEIQKKYIQKIVTIEKINAIFIETYNNLKKVFMSIDVNIKLNEIKMKYIYNKMNRMNRFFNAFMIKYEKQKNTFQDYKIKLQPGLYKGNNQIFTMNGLNEGSKKLTICFYDKTTVDIYYRFLIKK